VGISQSLEALLDLENLEYVCRRWSYPSSEFLFRIGKKTRLGALLCSWSLRDTDAADCNSEGGNNTRDGPEGEGALSAIFEAR
jgi:hypothetical protein